MTRKSSSQRDSAYGRSPAIDPDVNIVAVPRMGDEFTGNSALATAKDGKGKRKR